MQCGVGLNDDVLVRILFQFVDEHGLAGLERFGDFRMHAQSKIRSIRVSHRHLARFVLDFVAQRWNGFDHSGASAGRARLAQHTFQRLLGALARDADQAEFVEGKCFRRRFVLIERLLQRGQNAFAIAALFHVDEVNHDDAAKIAQANLPHDFFDGFEVGLDDGVFQARRTLTDELAGVDVDRHQRFGMVDDDVAAGFEPNFGTQRFVEFVLDAELFEDGLFLGVQLHAAHQLGLEAADEFRDFGELFFVVDPDCSEIVADVIAQDAFHEIQIAMQDRRSFALIVLMLDFVLRPPAAATANGFLRWQSCARRRCDRWLACKPGSGREAPRDW